MSKNTITAIVIAAVVIILLIILRFTSLGRKEESSNANNTNQSQNTNTNTTNANENTNTPSSASEFPNEFVSKKFGVSIRYPNGYTPDENYTYQMDPSKKIQGIKLTIPQSLSTGTNLSNDSYISLETLPNISAKNCTAERFAGQAPSGVQSKTDAGRTYSYATTTGAAAGNQYEEDINAFTSNNVCYAFRYFLHTTSVDNYPAGTVKEFNRTSLLTTFDKIRRDYVALHP